MVGSAVDTTEPSSALRKAVRTRLEKVNQKSQPFFAFFSSDAEPPVSSTGLIVPWEGTGSPVVGNESFAFSMLEWWDLGKG